MATEFPLDRTETRDNFAYWYTVPTRWNDNDDYGHVNNALYHSFFEAIIMHYLMVENDLDLRTGEVQCFTAENLCRYHDSLKYPDIVECGLRVGKLGNSSVRYEMGLFVKGTNEVRATGYFVDVYVDSETERPITIPDNIRDILSRLVIE